ncbi:hypothetical protein BP6252_10928 [Coleophoma cylindrospora]|uniref:Uncharacterized protein n=1 Tax=Coleophoma cylindrospora TaxID=1849047 RepID=A0A3D8QNI2_9HELO|nr:hypothetical protein BP6252_10928 [Coleophoma cylindrospora]
MLDPFTSLSLAATLCQFIDFGSKLVKGTYEIYESLEGQTKENEELDQRAENLGALSSSFVRLSTDHLGKTNSDAEKSSRGQGSEGRQLDPAWTAAEAAAENTKQPESMFTQLPIPTPSFQSFPVRDDSWSPSILGDSVGTQLGSDSEESQFNTTKRSEKEQTLRSMAASCKEIADDLRTTLKKLTVQKTRYRKFDSFRSALKSMWSKKKLDELEQRLDKYRSDLVLHDQQSSVIRELQALKNTNTLLESAHSKKLEEITRSLNMINPPSPTPKNGSKSRKEPRDEASDSPEENPEAALPAESATTPIEFNYLAEMLISLVSVARSVAAEQVVLGSLHFKAMSVRQDNVAEAYTDTFKWTFRQSKNAGKNVRKIYFSEWLTTQEGIFWVSGKPGSGKSTLMKYLCDHNSTREALTLWAQPQEPVISTHFFWSSGTTMQKSQEGLLRSLLYDVFKQCPKVVQEICPGRWAAAKRDDSEPEPWSLKELRQVINKLATCDGFGAKFCFFIDGLDEYDGDHAEIIKILGALGSSPIIKLCISSRPWNIFEDAYGKDVKRKLYVQELTHHDIRHYVQRKLEEHPNWEVLPSESQKYRQLVEEVTTKAQGVFLWVYLVVRSLHEGLTNGDTLSILQLRIRNLPADLEQYFKHMLESVDPFYHMQMVRTFQVAMTSDSPLALMIYSFLDEDFESEKFALHAPKRQMPTQEIDRRHKQMRRRLNGRCKGLLEVGKNSAEEQDEYTSYQVEFLHRTVRDFLRTKEMSNFLATEGRNSGPSTSILRAFVALIKSLPLKKEDMLEGGPLSKMLTVAFHFAQQAELESGQAQTELLDDLDYTLRVLSAATSCEVPWYQRCYSTHGIVENGDLDSGFPSCKTFLEFAIQKGLCLYAKDKLRPNRRLLEVKQPLLHCALRLCPDYAFNEPDMADTVRLLLDHGHDPNQTVGQATVWEFFVHTYALEMADESSTCRSVRAIQHRHRLIEILLSRGADPNVGQNDTPAWGQLLVTVARAELPGSSLQILCKTITVFLSYGADPMLLLRDYEVTSIWAAFLNVFLSEEEILEVFRLEFFSKMCCALLSYGADPAELSKEDVSRVFPIRLALPILDLIDEKGGGGGKEVEESEKGAPEEQVQWSYWNPWTWFGPGTLNHDPRPSVTLSGVESNLQRIRLRYRNRESANLRDLNN